REFIRYLSSDDLTNIQLGDQTEEQITLLFADIHGFSTISELLTTEDNFNFLNAFLKRIGPCIREHNGIIDKYIGDGVMALFPESPGDAVQASIKMQKIINQYNYERDKNNREPINFSIGLHYGNVQLGIIGDDDRYQATVISDDVNQTFRIEGLANEYNAPLLISEELYRRLDQGNKLQVRQLGKLQVKGKEKPVTIHEVIDADLSGQGELKKELKEIFNKAIYMYSEGQYADASQLFSKVLKVNPDDVAAQIYLNKSSRNLTS
ncbi:MAG: adenylate/guanylate cyclase domain-containing protein, partial [Candidatus Cyclobacteriaceae bacterium M2_1C_046]